MNKACFMDVRTLTSGINPLWPHFVTVGRKIHFAYDDAGVLKYKRSVDEGNTWSTPITVESVMDEIPLNQAIAASGQYVHVIYVRDKNQAGTPPTLYYKRSSDKGLTWGSEITIDNGVGGVNDSFMRAAIAVKGPYVHILWSSVTDGTFIPSVLNYRRSTDYGASFAAKVTPFAGATGAGRPDLIVENDNVYICWTDTRHGSNFNGGEPYFGKSEDNGASWTGETRMLTSANQSTARPCIAASDDVLIYTWQDPGVTAGSEDLYYKRSTDGGDTWGAATLFASGTSSQEHCVVDAKGSIFAATWFSMGDTPHNTYFRYSDDYGLTWKAQQQMPAPAVNASAPRIFFGERLVGLVETLSGDDPVLYLTPLLVDEPAQDTLLDDFNRADDSIPPPGTNWGNGVLTYAPGGGLAIVSNQITQADQIADYRQGGHWLADLAVDVDLVVEISAGSSTLSDGIDLAVRLIPSGESTKTGYCCNVDVISGSVSEWSLFRADGTGQGTVALTQSSLQLSAGDFLAFIAREDLFIGWHKPISTGIWQQIAAGLDSTYIRRSKVGLEFLNGQTVKVTNLWATELVPNFRIQPPLFV